MKTSTIKMKTLLSEKFSDHFENLGDLREIFGFAKLSQILPWRLDAQLLV
jgi:hypothetical protein